MRELFTAGIPLLGPAATFRSPRLAALRTSERIRDPSVIREARIATVKPVRTGL